MNIIQSIFHQLKKIYSPSYSYTLDLSFENTKEKIWTFKEFGTHTYVRKTWDQLKDSDFLKEVNPKDICYIIENEIKRKEVEKTYHISEESRNNKWTLTKGEVKINVSGYDFVKDKNLIAHTGSIDAVKIAYLTGFFKGRESSAQIITNKASDDIKKRQKILRLVK